MRVGDLRRGLFIQRLCGTSKARVPFIVYKLPEQLRQPRGLCGLVVGFLMNRINQQANEWTLECLDIHPTDKVLEVGFGPGRGIQQAATLASRGWVAGVDFSETMLRRARKRNALAIASGRVDLRYGSLPSLPYYAGTFDKIFAANVIYYLPEPIPSLQELWRVLRPGGRLVLFLYAKEDMAKTFIASTGVPTLYSGEEVARLLVQAGYRRAWFETKRMKLIGTGICALGEK